jgi:hypothetical protein
MSLREKIHPTKRSVVTREEAEEFPFQPQGAGTPGQARNRVVVPDEATVDAVLRRLTNTEPMLCGYCRNFDLQTGQREFHRNQQAFETAVRELEHDPAWYRRVDMMGACHVFEGHSPHAMAPAKIPNQFLDSTVKYEEQDRPTECPYWSPRKGGERSSNRRIISSPVHRKG